MSGRTVKCPACMEAFTIPSPEKGSKSSASDLAPLELQNRPSTSSDPQPAARKKTASSAPQPNPQPKKKKPTPTPTQKRTANSKTEQPKKKPVPKKPAPQSVPQPAAIDLDASMMVEPLENPNDPLGIESLTGQASVPVVEAIPVVTPQPIPAQPQPFDAQPVSPQQVNPVTAQPVAAQPVNTQAAPVAAAMVAGPTRPQQNRQTQTSKTPKKKSIMLPLVIGGSCFIGLMLVAVIVSFSLAMKKPKKPKREIDISKIPIYQDQVDGAGDEKAAAPTGPLTLAEAEKAAKEFEKAIKQNNEVKARRFINVHGIMDRAAKELKLNPDSYLEFKTQYVDEINDQGGAWTGFVEVIQEGGDLTFLRANERSGQIGVTFRFIRSDGYLDYIDFLLDRPKGSHWVSATDMYSFSTGEPTSKTFSRLMKDFSHFKRFGESNPGSSDIRDNREMVKMDLAVDSLQLGEAAQCYSRLTPKGKKDRFALLTKMRMEALGSKPYSMVRTLDQLERYYANDPSVQYWRLNTAKFTGDTRKAFVAIDRFDKLVNDPYLNVERASLYVQRNEFSKALSAFNEGKKKMKYPDVAYVRLTEIECLLGNRFFQEAINKMNKFAKDWEISVDEIEDSLSQNVLNEFKRTSFYRRWRQGRE